MASSSSRNGAGMDSAFEAAMQHENTAQDNDVIMRCCSSTAIADGQSPLDQVRMLVVSDEGNAALATSTHVHILTQRPVGTTMRHSPHVSSTSNQLRVKHTQPYTIPGPCEASGDGEITAMVLTTTSPEVLILGGKDGGIKWRMVDSGMETCSTHFPYTASSEASARGARTSSGNGSLTGSSTCGTPSSSRRASASTFADSRYSSSSGGSTAGNILIMQARSCPIAALACSKGGALLAAASDR